MKGLKDKIAFVTGGTGLIGLAVVKRLAQEGAVVVMPSRSLLKAKEVISSLDGVVASKIVPMELDLTNEEDINNKLEDLFVTVGIPTIVIANASFRNELGVKFEDLTYKHFSNLFDVDVAGHFICARKIADKIKSDNIDSGSIIFLSSIYAINGVDHSIYDADMISTPIHYSTCKASVIGMTKYLAALWGPDNIRVNTLVSGGVLAPGRQVDGFVEKFSKKTMLNRLAQPEEIASSIAFLSSSESSYITGTALIADGGFSAW